MYPKLLFLLLLISLTGTSCRKDLLSKPPDNSLFIPGSMADCWLLLDNENVMDRSPSLGELSGDDYYLEDSYYENRFQIEKNVYQWAKDLYAGTEQIYDWNAPYQQLFSANVVLESLTTLAQNGNFSVYDTLKGTALFKRAFAHFNLVQLFAKAYDSNTASSDPGIPLRTISDVNQTTVRASVKDCYALIISDLLQAIKLLRELEPKQIRNRPCKPAAMGLLARVYLAMGDYRNAGIYADSSLNTYGELIDYNSLSRSSTQPFLVRNAENLYTAKIPADLSQTIQPSSGQAIIDSTLMRSYDQYDLRKYIFFTDTMRPHRKNFYDGNTNALYTGIAVDEQYLIKAESLARLGLRDSALKVLNKLLVKRYQAGHFKELTASTDQQALSIILSERRKELVMRCLRWQDLKRLNKEEDKKVVLRRKIKGMEITLLPGSPSYVMPIPDVVIRISGIPQNPR